MVYVIIGGGGFCGANLIASLQENNDFTRIVIVDPSPRLMEYTHLKINTENIEFVKGSFLDHEVLDQVLPGATTVFHLSAIGHTGKFGAKRHHNYVRLFNVTATKHLVEKCKQYGVARFIYASSIAVCFIGEPVYNLKESEPYPRPEQFLDIYSATKAEAEQFVRSESTTTFKTCCLRFRAIYGPRDVSVAQKVVEMVRMNFLHFKITKNGHEAVSNMSSGRNCGLAMHLANEALKKNGKHGEIYNITDGEEVGQYAVWIPLIRALGRSPPQRYVSYDLVSSFVTVFSYIFYEIFNTGPPLTRFELEVLVTDNTYCIEKAEKELGYEPAKNHFLETVLFYKKETDDQGNRIQENRIFVCQLIASLVAALIILSLLPF